MLYELFGKILEANKIPDDWKEGYLRDLKEYKNWRGIMPLSTDRKVLNRTILERLRVDMDERLREDQAGFRKDTCRSCTHQIATLRIIPEQSFGLLIYYYISFFISIFPIIAVTIRFILNNIFYWSIFSIFHHFKITNILHDLYVIPK